MLALMCIYFSGCLLFTPARWHFSRVKIQHKGCSSKVFPTLLCHFFPHWSWQRIKWMCWDITGKSDVFLKYIGLFLKILFIYFYTEGKGGRKRGRETSMCGCLSHTRYWRPAPQPSHVPWQGIESVTLWFAVQHSIHWATPARAKSDIFITGWLVCLRVLSLRKVGISTRLVSFWNFMVVLN